MGKRFTARLHDGTERFAAEMSMGRSKLFVDMTRLLESEYIDLPSGLDDDHGEDEHYIDAKKFIVFFERVWEQGWIAEKQSGFFHNWARHAAGMVENMTLEPRQWVDRNGERLEVSRYLRPEEIGSE